ncbi:uncharacterized protein LOC144624758 [Crassostrea virginica]
MLRILHTWIRTVDLQQKVEEGGRQRRIRHCLNRKHHSVQIYLFGVDLSTGLCACCDYRLLTLLPKVQDTAWSSYERCPVGFTEVRRKTARFCFRLILTPEYYSVASVKCHEATRQSAYNGSLTSALVRLDSVDKLFAFETFCRISRRRKTSGYKASRAMTTTGGMKTVPGLCIQTSTDIAFGQILPSSGGDQGYFSPTLTAPTDSCYTFSPSEVSALYCGLVCLHYSRETYLIGVDHSKGLCACCDYPMLPKIKDTAWCSYQRCPVGFTEVRRKTARFCFRLILIPEYYSVASVKCHEATRQGAFNGSLTSALVRLDSFDKLYAFEYFLKNLNAPEDVWIQGVKGDDGVWRYEDGTRMSKVCPMDNTNGLDEFHTRFRTYQLKCSDRVVSPLGYACEANL